MGQNRDIANARAARAQPEKVAERVAIATRMLRDGETFTRIMAETRRVTGMGIGAGSIARIRAGLERERKKAERKAERTSSAVRTKEAGSVTIPAHPDVVRALVAAGVPFSFDGSQLALSGKGV